MKGSSKKIPMSVAPMSRLTKRAYLRLCPEKDEKKNLVHKGLSRHTRTHSVTRALYSRILQWKVCMQSKLRLLNTTLKFKKIFHFNYLNTRKTKYCTLLQTEIQYYFKILYCSRYIILYI